MSVYVLSSRVLAFGVSKLSTCVIVYVVDLSAFSARAAVMSAVLAFRTNCPSTYAVDAFVAS